MPTVDENNNELESTDLELADEFDDDREMNTLYALLLVALS